LWEIVWPIMPAEFSSAAILGVPLKRKVNLSRRRDRHSPRRHPALRPWENEPRARRCRRDGRAGARSVSARLRTDGIHEAKPVGVQLTVMKRPWTEASAYEAVIARLRLSLRSSPPKRWRCWPARSRPAPSLPNSPWSSPARFQLLRGWPQAGWRKPAHLLPSKI